MMATSSEFLQTAISNLGKGAHLNDLGKPSDVLGTQALNDGRRKTLTVGRKKKYVDQVLKRFSMDGSKPAKARMETGHCNEPAATKGVCLVTASWVNLRTRHVGQDQILPSPQTLSASSAWAARTSATKWRRECFVSCRGHVTLAPHPRPIARC